MLAATIAVAQPTTAMASAQQGPISTGSVVVTDYGKLQGTSDAGGRKFLGVPFAAAARWQDPVAPQSWGTREAVEQHEPCPQPAFAITDDANTYLNEDCLYLNVYTPAGRIHDLPVLFFIPGGGAANGNAAPYDGAELARTGNMIVVTANTRVGALGFLANSAFGADAGNYGAKDAVAALRWVKDNIGAFGGDAAHVTYSGFSSTTLLGCALLSSPQAAGLFSRIIQISAPCGLSTVSLHSGQRSATDFAADSGCAASADVAGCLRKLPVDKILTVQNQRYAARDVAGTPFLPTAPTEAIASGKFNRVPAMVTTDLDELRVFLAIALDSLASGATPAATAAALDETVPNDTTRRSVDLIMENVSKAPAAERNQMYSKYRAARDSALLKANKKAQTPGQKPKAGQVSDYAPELPDPLLFLAKYASDYGLNCTVLGDVKALSAYVPTYQAEFADRDLPNIFDVNFPFAHGAYHTIEQGLLWNLQFGAGPFTRTAAQEAERATVIGYITRFVAQGNPNGAKLPQWQAFTPTSPKNLWIDDRGIFMRSDYQAGHECSLWSQLPPPWQVG